MWRRRATPNAPPRLPAAPPPTPEELVALGATQDQIERLCPNGERRSGQQRIAEAVAALAGYPPRR